MIERKDYSRSLTIQDACNLSGVVHSFSELLTRLWKEANEKGKGTDWVNMHPLCILYASKIHSLTGCSDTFSDAYSECSKKADDEQED